MNMLKAFNILVLCQVGFTQGARLVGDNEGMDIASDSNPAPLLVNRSYLRSRNNDVPAKVVTTEPRECILESTLGYPESTEMSYDNHHQDILAITRVVEDKEVDYCLPKNSKMTDWCTHENEKGEYDELYNDVHTLSNVAGSKTTFTVTHWVHEGELYERYPSLQDIRIPAVLKITNLSKDVSLNPQGWTQPKLDKESIEKRPSYSELRGYQSKFSVTVSCSSECDCEAGDYTML